MGGGWGREGRGERRGNRVGGGRRETDRQTNRQTGRQADTETDGQKRGKRFMRARTCHQLKAVNLFTVVLAPPSVRKPPIKVLNFKSLRFPPSHQHVKGLRSKCAVLKVDLLQGHQIYCLRARMCARFQPGNFTGLGSEGVKADD